MQRSPGSTLATTGSFLGIAGSIIGLVIVMAAFSPASAGEVYQWKDAKGVTHYSQTPPPQGAYQQRDISSAGRPTQATTQVAKAATDNPQCTTARKNIEALKGQAAVQQDTDGDGKPDKTLSDADRANQLELALATVKATCDIGPAKP